MCKRGRAVVISVPPNLDIRYNNPGRARRDRIAVDQCLAPEIKKLWRLGIATTGCCCGHGNRSVAYIGVEEPDIKKMEALGYEHHIHSLDPTREDNFTPQTISLPRARRS